MAVQTISDKINYEGYDSEEVIKPIPYTNKKYYASTFGKIYELNNATKINAKKYKEVSPISDDLVLLELPESFCSGYWAHIDERIGKCVCEIDGLVYATFFSERFQTCKVISRNSKGKRRHYLENLLDVNKILYDKEKDFTDDELDKLIFDASFQVEDYKSDMKNWIAERDYQHGEEKRLENFLEELKVRRSSVHEVFQSNGAYMPPNWKPVDLSMKLTVKNKLIPYVRNLYHYFEREYAYITVMDHRLKVMRNGDIYYGPDKLIVYNSPIIGDYVKVSSIKSTSLISMPVDVIVMSAFNDKYANSKFSRFEGAWLIYHIDGDLHNNQIDNLITKEDLWKIEDAASDVLVADPDLYQVCLDIQINVAEDGLKKFRSQKKKLSNPELIQNHLVDAIKKLTYYLEIRYQIHKDELE